MLQLDITRKKSRKLLILNAIAWKQCEWNTERMAGKKRRGESRFLLALLPPFSPQTRQQQGQSSATSRAVRLFGSAPISPSLTKVRYWIAAGPWYDSPDDKE